MKKFSFVFGKPFIALLALALAFMSCGNGTTGGSGVKEPRTIEVLFDKIKSFDPGNFRAYDSADRTIVYCFTHQEWENFLDGVGYRHGEPPAFTLADAVQLQGWYYATGTSSWVDLPGIVQALDSFFTNEYKYLNTPAVNTTSLANGTALYGWYSFRLYRNGEGSYGASTAATQTPCMANYYYFGTPGGTKPIAIIDETVTTLAPYADIRGGVGTNFPIGRAYRENQYNVNDIITYTFNELTLLLGSEETQARVMENGKNPGLGVRSLHAQGITGRGVNVAIIDQNLLLNHPEFTGKIAAYYDEGYDYGNEGSMHAPGVTSLLVGNTIGTAPGAKVYFAAFPSWTGDSEIAAKALYWIIEESKKLPAGEKIRVVSFSANLSEPTFTNTHMWDDAVLAAQQNGILVLDCRDDPKTGIIRAAFYDPDDPENAAACTGGYPRDRFLIPNSKIGVPNSRRTTAEEYREGSPSYIYWGQGGLSWAIPYAAGVLALGWQVNPNLSSDQIVAILFATRTIARDGSPIINPVAFIDAVKKTVE